MPSGVAHELINHSGRDAGVFQPRREGVPQVVGPSQPQLPKQVVSAGRLARDPPALRVFGGKPGGVQRSERSQDGGWSRRAPAQPPAELLGRLQPAVAQRAQDPPRRVWQGRNRIGHAD
jgi:hypothetical protein